jgi:lipoate-protein ligase A
MGPFALGRYLTLAGEGAFLMGADAALLAAAEAGESPATLCVSAWTPPAVSVGRFQSAGAAIDAAAVARAGYDLVRRPTGGRAVLHDGDVTYTLVASHDDPAFGGRRAESLAAVAEALVAGLAALGVPAARAPGRARGAPAAAVLGAPPPCFASAAREEIQAGGRKLIGSARVEGRGAFLQHGSIPLTAAHRRLPDLMPLDALARRAARGELARASTCLEEVLGRRVDPRDLGRAIRAGFERRAGRAFVEEPLRPGETVAARRLAARYRLAAIPPNDASRPPDARADGIPLTAAP